MKSENPGWGGQRISDELRLMGLSVSKRTVLRILKDNGMVPPPRKFDPPSWRALLDSYKRIWGMDFTIVFDVKGQQLFVLNIVDWGSRKLLVSAVTYSPSSGWITQQIRNASMVSRGVLPEAMIRDNDGIFGKWLDPMLREEFGIEAIRIRSGQPWQNSRTERFHKSEKDEVLRRIPIADESHCRELITLYQSFFNDKRPHQALGGATPAGSTSPSQINSGVRFIKKPAVKGLITNFELVAA